MKASFSLRFLRIARRGIQETASLLVFPGGRVFESPPHLLLGSMIRVSQMFYGDFPFFFSPLPPFLVCAGERRREGVTLSLAYS
jgi:hypothetical protein